MFTADREGRPRCSLVQRCAYFNFVYSDTDFIKAITQDQKSLEELDQWLEKDDTKGESRKVVGRARQITTVRKVIQKLRMAFTEELSYVRRRDSRRVKYGTDLKKVMNHLLPGLQLKATTSN
jgi:hypothetical protein